MEIKLYHFFIETPDPNLWRRTYEGAPCLYYRTADQFREDLKRDGLITIDDAHISVYQIAYPLLREAKRKFMLFTPTALVSAKGYCNWEQLKEMSELGSIESHGHNHLPFDTLTEAEIEDELNTSYHLIKKNIGKPPKYVSCPASRRISRELVRKCGYENIRFNLGEVKQVLNRT